MKQLVQMLDTLVSRRADEESLSEQTRLEQLIKRYKKLVPEIEVVMIKTETQSRCYTYIEETKRVSFNCRRSFIFHVRDSSVNCLT